MTGLQNPSVEHNSIHIGRDLGQIILEDEEDGEKEVGSGRNRVCSLEFLINSPPAPRQETLEEQHLNFRDLMKPSLHLGWPFSQTADTPSPNPLQKGFISPHWNL